MGPVILLVVDNESEVGFDPLVVLFGLPICSGMISSGNVLCNPQYVAHFSGKLGCESGVSVTDNLVRESKVSEYLSDKEGHCFL